MSYFKIISCRWEKEELKKWTPLRKASYLLIPFLIYMVVNDMAEVILWAITGHFLGGAGEAVISFAGHYGATIRGTIGGIAILLGVAAVWTAVKNEINVPGGVKGDAVTAYAFLAACASCISISINIFFYQTGFTGRSGAYETVHEAQYGVEFLIGLVLYGVISPIAEEAIFRGLIYNRMKRCFGWIPALIFSSLLFGAYHGNVVQSVYGMLLGLMIAYSYELYGNFAAPVLFHAIANISVYAITYRNNLGQMDRRIALAIGAITFLAAISIAVYIKNKLLPKEK